MRSLIERFALRQLVYRYWQHATAIVERLERRHVFLIAAGIAFNVLLCVLPLLGLVIVVASLVLPPEDVRAAITDTVAGVLPPTQQVAALLDRLVAELDRVRTYALTATIVASAVLLWMASALLSSLRTALNAIFSIPTPGSFVWYKLRDVLLTLVLVAIVVAMLLVTPLLSLLSSNLTEAVPLLEQLHLSGWIGFGANVLGAFVLMYLLYHFVPSRPQPLFIIIRASIVALGLWELARLVFTVYIEHARSLGAVYGTFSLVVVAALWMYYTALIVVAAAEAAQYWWEQHQTKT
ncbi:MAG: YihY/virulence factor BrkB family protein [Chlorobi bacterium]|nr:YihY/virulence factor BrkB family protein [Chlorobiota bacterium]